MKIIITEKQFKKLQESDLDFNKTKTLVTDMWADGMEIEDIVMFTSLSYEQVLFLLKDSDIEIDCKRAEEIINLIFSHTDLIQKKITEDDFELQFTYTKFVRTLQFQYVNKKHFYLDGMATPYWDGGCYTPVDGSYAVNENNQSDDNYDGLGLRFKNPENFYSIGELIDWFNGEYRKNLLEKIEILVEHYRYEIEQKND